MTERYPKYLQIKETLLRGIASGRFKDLLPSENELAARFGVSRMTARRSLEELVREKIAVRIPGKGTYVSKQEFSQGVFRILPFTKYAEENDVTPKAEVIEIGVSKVPSDVAEKLGAERAVLVRRRHLFDDRPVRYERRYLREDLCGDILWEDLSVGSINEILTRKMNLPLTKVWQRLTAVLLPEAVAADLDMESGGPAFRMERLTYTFDRPVTHVTYYLTGDAFAFEDTFQPETV